MVHLINHFIHYNTKQEPGVTSVLLKYIRFIVI